MTIGLGSGRALWKVLELLAESRPAGEVARSRRIATEELAREAGFEVVELDGTVELDLALDGADEVDGELRLIKGGGGALLREKIVISAARRFVVVAEASKRVERLGETFRLPVEVVRVRVARHAPPPGGAAAGRGAAAARGRRGLPHRRGPLHPRLRDARRTPTSTRWTRRSKQVPGVVEHGLFIGMAERALLGRRRTGRWRCWSAGG